MTRGKRRLTIRRQPRSNFSVPMFAKKAVGDVAVSLVQDELRGATRTMIYKGLEMAISDEPAKKRLKKNLEESKALPSLLGEYTGAIEALPKPVQIIALLGEKLLSSL